MLVRHRPRLGKLPKWHIDHICVSEAWAHRTKVVGAWPGTINGVRLSDHCAVVVEAPILITALRAPTAPYHQRRNPTMRWSMRKSPG
jgi:hypothetical protein